MKKSISIACPHCLKTTTIQSYKTASDQTCARCNEVLFDGEPIELNADWLESYIQKNDTPLLMKFWAPWSASCLELEPKFAAAAPQLEPTVRLGRIITEPKDFVAGKYNILSVPTLILFIDKQEHARHTGLENTNDIVNWVEGQLATQQIGQ